MKLAVSQVVPSYLARYNLYGTLIHKQGLLMSGTLIIVSGLSGAGKTTIVEKCIAQSGVGVRVITCTTRRARGTEVDGKDYRFLSPKDYESKLAAKEFAEHASVYGNRYGTLSADIRAARENSPLAFLITDVQGTEVIGRTYPEARSIFISIPRNEFAQRLTKRGESPEEVERRLGEVEAELLKARSFDVVMENKLEQLETSIRYFLSCVNRWRAIDELADEYLVTAN